MFAITSVTNGYNTAGGKNWAQCNVETGQEEGAHRETIDFDLVVQPPQVLAVDHPSFDGVLRQSVLKALYAKAAHLKVTNQEIRSAWQDYFKI